MIGNPFLYRAADVRGGSMADDRNFVNLFGVSALNLVRDIGHDLWDLPLLMISAPGGGKSSLMRIFSPGALHYIEETSRIGSARQSLSEQMEALGAFRNGKPYAIGLWLRMGSEYRTLSRVEGPDRHGLFCALLNSRLVLSMIYGVCRLNNLSVAKDLNRLSFSLRSEANSMTATAWSKWGASDGAALHSKMSELENSLCEMTDDPFWHGDSTALAHTRLWATDLLANLDIMVDAHTFSCRPLVMLDDANELSPDQIQYLLDVLMSRQVAVPFWVSFRKEALGLESVLTQRIHRAMERGRDYQLIDFERARGDFRNRVLDISKLRVQSAAVQIGGLSQAFIDFVSDEREEVFLKNLDDRVARELKRRVLAAAGSELERFEGLISHVEADCSETHDLCRRLRMLEILIHREVAKAQKSFNFLEVSGQTLRKHENDRAIVEAAELFLAKEYRLPYYFGAQRLFVLSSFNVQQFLRLAGALFEEIMTAVRLDRDADSFLSQQRQHAIVSDVAKAFLDEIPFTVTNGSQVSRFLRATGDMCIRETYRQSAPYAPGVTGVALTMHDFETLTKRARRGDEACLDLYRAVESAVAHNVLEPEPNYKCKGQEFLVLYLNRLLCVPFQLPLQRGGFREQKLLTLLEWMKSGYRKTKVPERQLGLCE
jgi:hypothetical protein